MLVKFERECIVRLQSGIIAVHANAEKGDGTEKLVGEWWPEIGTVICPPRSHKAMRQSAETGKQEEYLPDWRVPSEGDKVVFGFKDVNIPALRRDGKVLSEHVGDTEEIRIIMDVAKAAYVIPCDGSEPYALGEWAVLEQIPRTIFSGNFISTFTQEYEKGIGIVRMAGDGFMESHPSAGPGKVVRYMTVSSRNPECPNHVGAYAMSRVKALLITGVDHGGFDEKELERLKSETLELEGITSGMREGIRSLGGGKAIPINPHMSDLEKAQVSEHNSRITRERVAEATRNAEIATSKQQAKKMLGSRRKYF